MTSNSLHSNSFFYLDFNTLFTSQSKKKLLDQLVELTCMSNHDVASHIDSLCLNKDPIPQNNEELATSWLITIFNTLFAYQHVTLVRGKHEPEYFPASEYQPARIQFAHGFLSSALHEISHWCIAGSQRRRLIDFGYWYTPDGRDASQQHQFEHLEIKPQALECLFTLACDKPFQVSQDNLFANFDTSGSTFATDVYQQAISYINSPQRLPRDAKILLLTLFLINNRE